MTTTSRPRRRFAFPRALALGFVASLVPGGVRGGPAHSWCIRPVAWLAVPLGGAVIAMIGGIATSHLETRFPDGSGGSTPPLRSRRPSRAPAS